MEIKIQIFSKVYSLLFGRKTYWFEQISVFSIAEEEYSKREVIWARHIWAMGMVKEKIKKLLPGI